MTLDDSLRGVREYVTRIGFPEERFREIRNVYNATRVSFEEREECPAPGYSEPGLAYQVRVLEWIHKGEREAAKAAREYAKNELTNKNLASKLRMG